MSVLNFPATADLLLLYPGESLMDQISLWTPRHPERQVATSFERSLPKIRTLLRNAGAAMVDATEDPSQATDAFLQAVARLGAGDVAMYTEVLHEGLELFARVRGSLFLLGPLFDEQWEEFLERWLRTKGTSPASWSRAAQRLRPLRSLDYGERRRKRFINRFRVRLDWPITDCDFN